MKIRVALAAGRTWEWFNSLSPEQQKEYLKKKPDSRFARAPKPGKAAKIKESKPSAKSQTPAPAKPKPKVKQEKNGLDPVDLQKALKSLGYNGVYVDVRHTKVFRGNTHIGTISDNGAVTMRPGALHEKAKLTLAVQKAKAVGVGAVVPDKEAPKPAGGKLSKKQVEDIKKEFHGKEDGEATYWVRESNDGLEISYSMYFRRNSSKGAFAENEREIKKHNRELENIAKKHGAKIERFSPMTREVAEEMDDLKAMDGENAYSEYEQSIGGHILLKTK